MYSHPDYRRFIGDDQTFQRTSQQQDAFVESIRQGLISVILNWSPPISPYFPENFRHLQQKWPATGSFGFEAFMHHLFVAKSPYVMAADYNNGFAGYTGPYIDATGRSLESRLRSRILSSGGGLYPADVARMALGTSNGNYSLAMLLAHNLLKNVTYEGRAKAKAFMKADDRMREWNQDYFDIKPEGDVAAKLVNLRPSNCFGLGHTDKMGPWYHVFIPLTMAAWTSVPLSYSGVAFENTLRWCCGAPFGSPNDNIKAAFDWAGASAAYNISKAMHLPWMKKLNMDFFGLVIEPSPAAYNQALIEAILGGDLYSIKEYLRRGADPNAMDGWGVSVLQRAALNNDAAAIEALTLGGADLNMPRGPGGMTALLYAAMKGNAAAVGALIRAGANINQGNDDGWTPLGLAHHYGFSNVEHLLQQAGAQR